MNCLHNFFSFSNLFKNKLFPISQNETFLSINFYNLHFFYQKNLILVFPYENNNETFTVIVQFALIINTFANHFIYI